MNIFVVDDRFAFPITEEVPKGFTSLSAQECGACHADIYAEWSDSMHADAWRDPYFETDFRFDGSQQICLNCHTPFRNQQENLVLGFRDRERFRPNLESNPDFDPAFRDEGVTCAVCHVRNGRIVGPHGLENAYHPVEQDSRMKQGLAPCVRCHVVSGKRWDTFFRIPPCGTVAEISETGHDPDCVGCHMPPVTRPLVAGSPPREGRKHLFRGGHHPETVAGAVSVDVRQRTEGNKKLVEITLTNTGAGHYLPTGTPDRHLTLELTLWDETGQVLRKEIYTLKRTILWRPFIVDLRDTRLQAEEPRVFNLVISETEHGRAQMLEVTVRYHLLEEERRLRIGYENTTPISYVIYEMRIPLREVQ